MRNRTLGSGREDPQRMVHQKEHQVPSMAITGRDR